MEVRGKLDLSGLLAAFGAPICIGMLFAVKYQIDRLNVRAVRPIPKAAVTWEGAQL